LIVDGAHVAQRARPIDDEHMRRRLRIVGAADIALRIEQHGRRLRVTRGREMIGAGGVDETLLAGRRGNDREPDDAARGRFLLELLHVAGAVVFFHVGTAVVRPFKHDRLAFELAERTDLAGGVDGGEGGRGLADCRRCDGCGGAQGEGCGGSQNDRLHLEAPTVSKIRVSVRICGRT
jgi:hypothetical protein